MDNCSESDYKRAQIIIKSLIANGAIPSASSEERYLKLWDAAIDAQSKLAELDTKPDSNLLALARLVAALTPCCHNGVTLKAEAKRVLAEMGNANETSDLMGAIKDIKSISSKSTLDFSENSLIQALYDIDHIANKIIKGS